MGRQFAVVTLVIAAAGVIATLALFAVSYAGLPQTIPVHFGADGSPDGYGPKSTLVLFPVMSIVFFGIFTGVSYLVEVSRQPTPPAFPFLMRILVAESVWMFFFIVLSTLHTVSGRSAGLGIGFFICMGLMFATGIAIAVNGIAWAINRARTSL